MLERVVGFRTQTVLKVIVLVIAVSALLRVISVARGVLVWVLISVFLALALNPLVDFLQRRAIRRRGLATAATFAIVLTVGAALGATFVPTLVAQVDEFVEQVPDYVAQLTQGEGRLGFLEERYNVTERVREAVGERGAAGLLGLTGAAVAVAKGVLNAIVATVTIAFLTFFMLLEGRGWIDRAYALLPVESQARWRAVGHDVYRTVGGYVTGNLLISLIAGVVSTVVLVLVDVPYAVALGLLVAILDLIPLAGATLAAIIVSTVAFIDSTVAGLIVAVFFLVYQQLENHVLQPVVYGRTVQLSPLAVLIAVLIGAELAGVLGALGAIPIAGALQVLIRDWLAHRRLEEAEPSEAPLPPPVAESP